MKMTKHIAQAIRQNMPTYAYGMIIDDIYDKDDIPDWTDEDIQLELRVIDYIESGKAAEILGDNAKDVILDPEDISFFLSRGTLVFCEDDGEVHTVLVQITPNIVVTESGQMFYRDSLTVID